MKTVFIIMTILGCDDSVRQCEYIDQVNAQYDTVQACDSASEKALSTYGDRNYPVVVAVCQGPAATQADMAGIGEDGVGGPLDMPEERDLDIASETVPAPPAEIPEAQGFTASANAEPGFISRALSEVRSYLPEQETMKSVITKPVHIVSDSYSWVAKKF